jgi:Uma2 family endonuclease
MERSDNIWDMDLFPMDRSDVDVGERRVLLNGVSWEAYESLRESIGNAVRLNYLEQRLEIMTVGHAHEVSRTMLNRLLELFCLERDIALFSYGHKTMKRRAKRAGLEPDAWYNRGRAGRVPSLALEVVYTNPLINKLEIYARLGVREVWVFEKGQLRILKLRGTSYRRIATSKLLPEVDTARLVHYAKQEDQHAALRAFRDELRR